MKGVDLAKLERFSNVKAVYFDLDDTLCGYWLASKAGLKSTFDKIPIEGKTTDEMIQAWGNVFREFSPELKEKTKLYHEYLTSGTVTRNHQMQLTLLSLGIDDMDMAKRLGDSYMFERDHNLKLFPEAIKVLDTLHGRYQLGLITNGPADIQNQEIDTLGIRHYMDNIYIEGELRLGKPHKSVFDQAAKSVNLNPEQILMVGNSYGHDIKPAIKFGWVSAWVRRDTDVAISSRTGKPEDIGPNEPKPDLILSDLTDLLPLLTG
jgi:putative hydrolase of the HAD superfamily